eukprot:TRINITY_DN7437_c0_g1_i7.p2 TRINITY_DN7437_c0_g1~~TRINITY_DN7437_c0_g1_i7.p2  ORF type:complete len:150 (+),score=35.19 TRINITY_DN7437_c0_g1_i7:108-557(+)
MPSLVGSEMCIRDSINAEYMGQKQILIIITKKNKKQKLFVWIKFIHTFKKIDTKAYKQILVSSIASAISGGLFFKLFKSQAKLNQAYTEGQQLQQDEIQKLLQQKMVTDCHRAKILVENDSRQLLNLKVGGEIEKTLAFYIDCKKKKKI